MHLLVISFNSIVFLIVPICYSYKVLVVSPTPVLSHVILNRALVKLLLEAGFEVTHITVMRNKRNHPHLTQIFANPKDLSEDPKKPQIAIPRNDREKSLRFTVQQFSAVLKHTSVSKLLRNTSQKFDLIIAEWLFSNIFTGLAALYDCPFIWLGVSEPNLLMLRLVDKNHVSSVTINEEYDREAFAKIFEPLLAIRGKPLVSFDEMRSVASLVLVNSHGSHETAWLRKFIPIAGFHVEMNMKPLHETVKRVMDNAKDGFMYMSLGTNLNIMDWPSKIRNSHAHSLLQMFGKVKRTVLWQHEKKMRYLPSNVHILNWTSQQSILSHPNCVLFITHGGRLSTIESLHYGVPMIGIPAFGDHFTNVDNVVAQGVAIKVMQSHSMVNDIQNAIMEMLNKSSYRKNAKKLSNVYRRRSTTAKKDLIYWVNYTIHLNNFPNKEDVRQKVNTRTTFKIFDSNVIYIFKNIFIVGIVTLAVFILVPFIVKVLVSFHKKSKKTKTFKK